MKELLIYALIFGGLRLIENLIDKMIAKSKLTANTWDDAFFGALKAGISGVLNIFGKRKK